jgi:hypothetical protein
MFSEEYELVGQDVLMEDNEASFFDLQAHLGLGIRFDRLAIEGRYNFGLSEVTSEQFKNANLQIGAAIFLGGNSSN